MMLSMNMVHQLQLVRHFLNDSNEYNLSAECVLSALHLMRDNPDADLQTVLNQACITWDIHPPTEADCWNDEYGPYE